MKEKENIVVYMNLDSIPDNFFISLNLKKYDSLTTTVPPTTKNG